MLRITMNEEEIRIERYTGLVMQNPAKPRVYPRTLDNQQALFKALEAHGNVEHFGGLVKPVWIVRHRPHYYVVDGTHYDERTPKDLVEVLEYVRRNAIRVKMVLGNQITGEPWGDLEVGYIGRSMGPIKIPLVIPKSDSTGGGALMDHCVLQVTHSNKANGGILWIHPAYRPAEVSHESA